MKINIQEKLTGSFIDFESNLVRYFLIVVGFYRLQSVISTKHYDLVKYDNNDNNINNYDNNNGNNNSNNNDLFASSIFTVALRANYKNEHKC